LEKAVSDCAKRILGSPSISDHSIVGKALKISQGGVVAPAALPVPITVQVSLSSGENTSVGVFFLVRTTRHYTRSRSIPTLIPA